MASGASSGFIGFVGHVAARRVSICTALGYCVGSRAFAAIHSALLAHSQCHRLLIVRVVPLLPKGEMSPYGPNYTLVTLHEETREKRTSLRAPGARSGPLLSGATAGMASPPEPQRQMTHRHDPMAQDPAVLAAEEEAPVQALLDWELQSGANCASRPAASSSSRASPATDAAPS